MSATPEVLALLEDWLSEERSIDDKLEQIRNLVCDLAWAGDDLHRETDLIHKHAPKGFAPDLPQYREAWREVGGQRAVDAFDGLAGQIRDALVRS